MSARPTDRRRVAVPSPGGAKSFPAPFDTAVMEAGKAQRRRRARPFGRLGRALAAAALVLVAAAGCKSTASTSSGGTGNVKATTTEYDCTFSFVEPHPVLGGGRVTGEIQATCAIQPRSITITIAVEHQQGDATWKQSPDVGKSTVVPETVPQFVAGDAECADGAWRTVYAWSGVGVTGAKFNHPFDATGATQTSDIRTVDHGECPK